MIAPKSDAEIHKLIANALCLNFANTLYGHGNVPIHEYLKDYRDLVLWSRHAGILDERQADALIREGTRRPTEAVATFHRAIALRETLFRTFTAIANGESPKPNDLAALNSARTDALSHSKIDRSGDRFNIAWTDEAALARVLWPIALSAAELLTSEDLHRVRECDGDTCDWLFVDTSRNHLRRWCSMHECGNRAKVRRYLKRKRKLALQ